MLWVVVAGVVLLAATGAERTAKVMFAPNGAGAGDDDDGAPGPACILVRRTVEEGSIGRERAGRRAMGPLLWGPFRLESHPLEGGKKESGGACCMACIFVRTG
jgi:hypothetical protein